MANTEAEAEIIAAAIAERASAETQRSYRAAWQAWQAQWGRPLATATRGDVLAWLKGQRAAGLSAGTVATRLAACAALFRAVQAAGLLPAEAENIFTRRGAPVYVDQAHRAATPLPPDVEAQLLGGINRETVRGARDYALLGLLLATGARAGVVVALPVGAVQVTPTGAAVQVGDRAAAVPVELYRAVQDYLAAAGRVHAAPDAALFRPLRGWLTMAFGRPVDPTQPITVQQARDILRVRLADTGCPNSDGYSLESLRATFAQRYLAAKPGDVPGLQGRLGHAHASTTAAWLVV